VDIFPQVPRGIFREARFRVVTLFGTRPEIIKLAPVIAHLEADPAFEPINVASGQHTSLLYPLAEFFGVRIDFDLEVMQPGQTPGGVCGRALAAFAAVLAREKTDLVLVQGDTVTALAGALAGWFQRVAVGHVEAGLRSGDLTSPFPEELNRRLITQLATYHFAATARNRATLLAEGVPPEAIFVTGNPVVDSLHAVRGKAIASEALAELLRRTAGLRRLVLTTHRRESFGETLSANLAVLRRFVEGRADVALLFPVHPNPAVQGPATALLSGHDRIHLLPPLDYVDFISLLQHAWLIVSDSGGVQEEAPTLGKPLLVLRDTTERPEALECRAARLVGGCPHRLRALLDECYEDSRWAEQAARAHNPFGAGDSGRRIVAVLRQVLSAKTPVRPAA
jgi:UDP-N-acetylglucosamine 2-epimerase (non-hydrolysing)